MKRSVYLNQECQFFGGSNILKLRTFLFLSTIANINLLEGVVSKGWRRTVMIPTYKGKVVKGNCKNYKRISLIGVVVKDKC